MKTIAAATAALLLGGVARAWAVLGESVRSVQTDQQYFRGQLLTSGRQGYALHQISAPSHMVIREYVSHEGTVFGVAWEGPAMPDLPQLLGSYFAEFQQAAQNVHRRHGPLVVETDHLVVESAGHMRAFHGRAYVPSLVPNSLTPAVVQ